MTLAEMMTALKRFGFDDDDPLLTWLNAGMFELVKAYNWWWLEYSEIVSNSLVTSLDPFIIGNQYVDEIRAVIDAESAEPLKYVPYKTFVQTTGVDAANAARGNPNQFSVTVRQGFPKEKAIYIWPLSDSPRNFIVYMLVKEQAMTDEAPNFVPEDLHYAIVVRAAVFGLEAENEEDRAAQNMATYTTLINNAVGSSDKTSGPLFVQDTY